MNKIDSLILSGCTKFAHWFQRLTGRTNFFIAKFGRFLSFSALICQISDHFLKFISPIPGMAGTILLTIIALGVAYEGKLCEDMERHIQNGSDTLPAICQKMRSGNGIFTRLIFIAFTIWSLVEFVLPPHPWLLMEFIFDVWFPLGGLIFFYFVAVNPLPPGKSKVREWIESFSERKLVPAKAKS